MSKCESYGSSLCIIVLIQLSYAHKSLFYDSALVPSNFQIQTIHASAMAQDKHFLFNVSLARINSFLSAN